MIETLPTARPFLPSGLRWRLATAEVEGPGGFGLPTDVGSTDGGGWWVAEYSDMQAGTPDHHRALRALAGRLRGGARIDVPFIEQRPTGGLHLPVPLSDGSTLSDGSAFTGGLMDAVLEDAVILRADELTLRIETGQSLLGGDMFSIWRGPDKGSELHCTSAVTALADNRWAVEIFPPLRQGHDADVALNFNTPACAMQLRDPEGAMWPRAQRNWNLKASALFVEALR